MAKSSEDLRPADESMRCFCLISDKSSFSHLVLKSCIFDAIWAILAVSDAQSAE